MTKKFRRALWLFAGAAFAVTSAPAAADGILDDPLARFEDPLCPGVVGLRVDYASAIVARIRGNAEDLGLKLANVENCEPNLIVTILSDGQDYLRRLADDEHHLFDTMSRSELRELLDREGPARAWISAEMRTRDGFWIGRRDNLADLPNAKGMAAHSRIYVPVRRDILASMVLIDRDAVAGLSPNQIGDYATLVGLAEYVPEPSARASSIQSLFQDDDNRPDGLTEFDTAYLSRLYSSIPNVPASVVVKGLEDRASLRE